MLCSPCGLNLESFYIENFIIFYKIIFSHVIELHEDEQKSEAVKKIDDHCIAITHTALSLHIQHYHCTYSIRIINLIIPELIETQENQVMEPIRYLISL